MHDEQMVFRGGRENLPNTISNDSFLAQLKEFYWTRGIKDFEDASWYTNYLTLSAVINENIRNKKKRKLIEINKYVVPAPSGSGKTASIIAYCSLLPDMKGIIVTNTQKEADDIASNVSLLSFDDNLEPTVSIALKTGGYLGPFQPDIHVIPIESYKSLYKNDVSLWKKLHSPIDLLIIDYDLNKLDGIAFQNSLVCFDSKASLSENYSQIKDVFMLGDTGVYDKEYDHSDVMVYTTKFNVVKDDIDMFTAMKLMGSVQIGEKTLIITHKENQAKFYQALVNLDLLDDKVAITNWGELSSSNKWRAYDTCIITGLNCEHKDTMIAAEIIEGMHRINIREAVKRKNKAPESSIYIAIPYDKEEIYKKSIQEQMPKINFDDWILDEDIEKSVSKFDETSIVKYVQDNLQVNGRIPVSTVQEELNIKQKEYDFNTKQIYIYEQYTELWELLNKANLEIVEFPKGKGKYFYTYK